MQSLFTGCWTSMILILVPLNALWQRHRPQDIGLQPKGAVADPPHAETLAPASLGSRTC